MTDKVVEHALDYSRLLAVTRAVREQIDWPARTTGPGHEDQRSRVRVLEAGA